MKPHFHAKLIKLWADGHEIQKLIEGHWYSLPEDHTWYPEGTYRVKPTTLKYRLALINVAGKEVLAAVTEHRPPTSIKYLTGWLEIEV